jgi:integrase
VSDVTGWFIIRQVVGSNPTRPTFEQQVFDRPREWLRAAELEDTTRRTYVGYIERTIIPELGPVPADKLTALTLERFFAELRRCRARCDGRPFVERHAADGEHDCVASSCRPHACRPMAASTVRQIHRSSAPR